MSCTPLHSASQTSHKFWLRCSVQDELRLPWPSTFLLFARAAFVIIKANCSENMAPKMGPPPNPIFGTYGGHFCGRSETRFNGIGKPKLGPPKTQIETQNWCQFLSPSFDTIYSPRDAISKYINPACLVETWEAPITRSFFQPKQAPFPGPWNHAEVKATSQIALRVVQKAPLLIRSGKYLICVWV